MGKTRRQRTKLHQTSTRKKEVSEESETKLENVGKLFQAPQGVFAGTNIDISALTGKLHAPEDEDDRMSFISKKSLKDGQGQMTKKDKMKMRREKWLDKVEALQLIKKKKKEAKKRSAMPIVGDLQPLSTALPELSEILQLSEEAGRKANKRQRFQEKEKKSTLTSRDRKKLVSEETERFKQVLQHDAFKENPFAAINKHLTLKLQQDEDQR